MDSTGFIASENKLIMRNTIIAAITTVVLNLVMYFIGDAAGWIPDTLPERAENFGIPAVIASTVIPVIAGGIVLTLLIHMTNHPVLLFCLIASVVFIATLAAPLSVAGSSRSFATFLVMLHVITVVVGVALLTRNVADEPE
jgi:hypothetical protein